MIAILAAFAILIALIVLVLVFSEKPSPPSPPSPLTAHGWRVSYPSKNPVWMTLSFTDARTFTATADDGSTLMGTYDDYVLYPKPDRKDVFMPYAYAPNDDSLSVITLGGKADVHIFNDARITPRPTTPSPTTNPPQTWCQCICASQPEVCDANGMVRNPQSVSQQTFENCYAQTGQISGPCLPGW